MIIILGENIYAYIVYDSTLHTISLQLEVLNITRIKEFNLLKVVVLKLSQKILIFQTQP